MLAHSQTHGRTTAALATLAVLAAVGVLAGTGEAAFVDALANLDRVWSGPVDGLRRIIHDVLSRLMVF